MRARAHPTLTRITAAAVCVLVAGSAWASDGLPAGDVAYGEYLSGDCTAWHKPDGAVGIPPIVGWYPEDFALAMQDFRDGTRKHQIMEMMASRLDDDQIAALAAYFASLAP